MMERAVAVACLVACFLAAAERAHAKEFSSLVVVGTDGTSREFRLSPHVVDQLFSGDIEAFPLGGYLRVYPLGPTGHVGVPGRFYPRTGAVCLSWNQAAPPRNCRRLGRELRGVLAEAVGLARFRGSGTTLTDLASASVSRVVALQLRVAVELAFDRFRLARPARPPIRCLRFTASWRGPGARARPRAICLSAAGVYAAGTLYPLRPEPWRLAWSNRLPPQ